LIAVVIAGSAAAADPLGTNTDRERVPRDTGAAGIGAGLLRQRQRSGPASSHSESRRTRITAAEYRLEPVDEAASARVVVLDAPPAELPDAAAVQIAAQPLSDLPALPAPVENVYPLDLATAWRLAGASNLQVALAAERIQLARAEQRAAEVLWIPSLVAGLGYNSHTGQIQATEGDIVETNRESLFVGAGGGFGSAPLNGGSGGPARLFVDLSLVDAIFEPLAARQVTRAVQADHTAAFNDVLLQVTIAYYDLVRAQVELAIADAALDSAGELATITGDFARTGAGLQADADRAQAEFSSRRRMQSAASERLHVASAELARLLRLDPTVVLFALEERPAPVDVFGAEQDAHALISQAYASRPELARQSWIASASADRVRQETLRPWIPNVHVGMSSGGFGGGRGDAFGDFSDRTDFDALLIWRLENLGLGNHARRQQLESVQRQANLEYARWRELVAAEVVQAHQQVLHRREQIADAEAQLASAAAALPLNFEGIRELQLRAIEAQQAIAALATARSAYVGAVLDFNAAQFALLRAVGQPPGGYGRN
jgi:outer membrane protein TolC